MQLSRSSVEEELGFPFLVEEMNRMTLQVVMQGSDGVVLASDTCETEMNADVRGNCDVPKIRSVSEHRMSYASSGDECSVLVGRRIEAKLRSGLTLTEELLQEAANEVHAEEKVKLGTRWEEKVSRRLLIVNYLSEEAETWRLKVAESSYATRIVGQETAGDSANLARFIIRRYYDKTMPVEILTMLAAHFILTGAQLNSAMVGGLEVAIYQNGQERFLSATELAKLTYKSQQLDKTISDILFPRQQR